MKNIVYILLLVVSGVFAQKNSESLKIDWSDEYRWKIISDQELADQVTMIELIPENETAENWTIIGCTVTLEGVPTLAKEVLIETTFDQILFAAPTAKKTIIEEGVTNGNDWVIYKVEVERYKDTGKPESQLYFTLKTKKNLYNSFVALKAKSLEDDFVKKWTAIFKASKVIGK